MKKLLLGLGTLTAVAIPVVAVVSCGTETVQDLQTKYYKGLYKNGLSSVILHYQNGSRLPDDLIQEFNYKMKNSPEILKLREELLKKVVI